VTFDPASDEGTQLPHALDMFQYQLKGVSFLPRARETTGTSSEASPSTPYPQMPYESISQDRYVALMRTVDVAQLRETLPASTMLAEGANAADNADSATVDEVPDKFCDTAACTLDNL
jgi:ribonucleoside-triphosphate reductase